MRKEDETNWTLYLGVRTNKSVLPLTIKDKSGIEFIGLEPANLKTDAAIQKGVTLVFKASFMSSRNINALDFIDPIISRVLNTLSFLLLQSVYPLALEIVESQINIEKPERFFLPNYAPNSWGRFQTLGFEFKGKISNKFEIKYSDRVEVAINWFLRGTGALTPVESFTCYWLALESLAPKIDHIPLTMRCCGYELDKCPSCEESTKGAPGMRMRMKYLFVEQLGKSEEFFKEIWKLRNKILHGSSQVFQNMMNIAGKACEIRHLAVNAIKLSIGIDQNKPPYISADGYIVGQAALEVSKK